MATEKKQSYELMVIFTPVLSEDGFKSAQNKFTDLIKSLEGKISHSDAWGLRSLAYPIQKKTTGLYWVLEFESTTDVIAKLELQMNRDENVMRHMVTALDKFALEYNNRKRNKTSEPATENV